MSTDVNNGKVKLASTLMLVLMIVKIKNDAGRIPFSETSSDM